MYDTHKCELVYGILTYEELANFIWKNNLGILHQNIIESIVEFCKSENPKFNEDLFYQTIEEHPMNDFDESNHP
tara:strand:- start:201 stop:422 length:222 start_codon:yes stop_codon:yes gene_type:complete